MKYKFGDIIYNITEKRKPTEEDRLNYIGLEHLDSGSLFVTRWGAERTPEGEKIVMKKGDVLFGKRRAYQKKVAISPIDGVFSAHGMVLRPKENVICKEFLPFFISSDYFLNEAIRISVGGLSPTINWKDIKELEFNLPSIDKQKVLAEKLWAAYEVKQSYLKMIDATDEMVKAQFIEILKSSDCSYVLLGNLCTRITDGSHNPPKGVDFSDYIMISSKNINVNSLNMSDVRYLTEEDFQRENERTKIAKGDVLLTIVGTIGRAYVVKGDEGNLVMQRSVAVLSPGKNVASTFLMYSLSNDEKLEKEGRGNAQKGVYLKQLSNYKIKLPVLEKQKLFEDIYEQAAKSKAELRKSIDAIDKVIKSLINENL